MKISVFIPTLNEEQAIGGVVQAVPRNWVDEIIVADNGSTDDNVKRALAAGARVVHFTASEEEPGMKHPGKGAFVPGKSSTLRL